MNTQEEEDTTLNSNKFNIKLTFFFLKLYNENTVEIKTSIIVGYNGS